MGKYIVATGNAFSGLILWGPFEEYEDAEKWAKNTNEEYNIVFVERPTA